jgi:hypothetical protein
MKYKGKQLDEITKGSLDYQRMDILQAFRTAFPESDGCWYSVEEVFNEPGHQTLIVQVYGPNAPDRLMPDEFYQVDFTQQGESFSFAQQPWPVVELTYQPQTPDTTAEAAPITEAKTKLKVNTSKVSDTAWGDVDKTALGNSLADAYAAGQVTKAQIREVYAFVPDDAFGTDAEGQPTFAYTKAFGPHHEIINAEIVLNRAGLGAAAAALAGARGAPSLSVDEKKAAMTHLRKHYAAIKEDAPAGIKESSTQPPTGFPQITENRDLGGGKKGKGKRLIESVEQSLSLDESAENDNPDGPWRIHGIGITANVINANNRRYPASVLEAAVRNLRSHLNESAGQGRLSLTDGESDHPADKGNRRHLLSETVVNWDSVDFDGRQVQLQGNLLGTTAGKDIRAQMKGGVKPGISQRANGETVTIKVDGVSIDEVTDLVITGYDLTAPNEASDPEAQVTLFESINPLEDEMNLLEELKKLLAEHPEIFQGVTEAQLKAMSESQLKTLEGQIREALGIDGSASIFETMKKLRADAAELQESKRKTALETAISEATKDLPYGDEGNKMFLEAIHAANPQDAAAVKSLVESKRKEYDKLFAGRKLEKMGFSGVHGVMPVLESETGTPEFARASFQLAESVRNVTMTPSRDWSKVRTANELFAKKLLERFDKIHQRELLLESRALAEATQTSDLNLPYSVSRLIIEEAYPTLVASGLFDVGIMNNSPERLYFERFSGESGYTGTSTSETVVADLDVWVKLTYGRITPNTFVLTNSTPNVTYTENEDYIVDYAGGRVKALATITDGQSLRATYNYTALRNGEMAPIQRAKLTQDYIVIEAAADRLADLVSREAIVFSQSQMNYDVTARLLANLVKQQQRKIDQGMLMLAWSQVHGVDNNEAGIWTPGTEQTDYAELVRLMGLAKIKVNGRFYKPTYFLCSDDNAEILSNWEGFTRQGFPDAILNAEGYAGAVKSLPVFASTEFPDDIILCGNKQLVQYRVFQPMAIRGPLASYNADGKIIAADQYYTEEFNATESPIAEKGSYVTIGSGSSGS